MKFKIGQKVVCINKHPIAANPYNSCLDKLREGKIYTVRGTLGNGLQLSEVRSLHPLGGFDKSRFRPIETDWVDSLLLKLTEEKFDEELIRLG